MEYTDQLHGAGRGGGCGSGQDEQDEAGEAEYFLKELETVVWEPKNMDIAIFQLAANPNILMDWKVRQDWIPRMLSKWKQKDAAVEMIHDVR